MILGSIIQDTTELMKPAKPTCNVPQLGFMALRRLGKIAILRLSNIQGSRHPRSPKHPRTVSPGKLPRHGSLRRFCKSESPFFHESRPIMAG